MQRLSVLRARAPPCVRGARALCYKSLPRAGVCSPILSALKFSPAAPTQTHYKHTMVSNIVLPPLTSWAEGRLTAIFQATDEQTFDDAFDAFVAAEPASIVLNGQKLTRAQYKSQLWKDKFLEAGASVQYLGAVSVPKDENKPVEVRLPPYLLSAMP